MDQTEKTSKTFEGKYCRGTPRRSFFVPHSLKDQLTSVGCKVPAGGTERVRGSRGCSAAAGRSAPAENGCYPTRDGNPVKQEKSQAGVEEGCPLGEGCQVARLSLGLGEKRLWTQGTGLGIDSWGMNPGEHMPAPGNAGVLVSEAEPFPRPGARPTEAGCRGGGEGFLSSVARAPNLSTAIEWHQLPDTLMTDKAAFVAPESWRKISKGISEETYSQH